MVGDEGLASVEASRLCPLSAASSVGGVESVGSPFVDALLTDGAVLLSAGPVAFCSAAVPAFVSFGFSGPGVDAGDGLPLATGVAGLAFPVAPEAAALLVALAAAALPLGPGVAGLLVDPVFGGLTAADGVSDLPAGGAVGFDEAGLSVIVFPSDVLSFVTPAAASACPASEPAPRGGRA